MQDFIIGIIIGHRNSKNKCLISSICIHRLHPILVDRFEKSFNKTSNTIITFRGIHFVMLNSMTMERDGCGFCEKAENDIRSIALKLKCTEHGNQTRCKYITPLESYSRPILLQHFPTYRPSDVDCIEGDSPLNESYREGWEVISKSATDFLGKYIKPRVSFSGHSHHYCYLVNSLGIDEYTIASFNWRNKVNPSFLLVSFIDNYFHILLFLIPIHIISG